MREIKFRAYTDKGEMIYNYCQLIGNRFFGEDMTNTNYGNIIDIMQFTGLHDCEGKEIYEGDIVQRTVIKSDWYPSGGMGGGKEHPITKTWEEKQTRVISMNPEIRFGHEFITKTKTKESIEENECVNEYDYIVVGNIHKDK